MKSRKKPYRRNTTRVVGTVHTASGLLKASRLVPKSGIDTIEVRLDFVGRSPQLASVLSEFRLPILLTARHPREGGGGNMPASRRRELLLEHLPVAAMIDIELRSAESLGEILTSAGRRIEKVLSFHDFSRTPTPTVLRRKQREALQRGATICKIACYLRNAADLAKLLVFQAGATRSLATMGMGPLGKVSRLVLPLAGSCLVYGYIDRPQVAGQWPADQLARRLKDVTT